MHSVAPRQEMAFPHHAHAHASSGHGPRRHNTTTALDTSSIDSMSHSSHIRVNSLSSKGSLSDYPLLRTPQDSVQSENDALIVKSQDEPSAWKPSMGIVQETLTSSPIDESFGARARAGSTGGKPLSMHINTNFTQRSRAVPFSAHPNQKLPATSQIPAPQSATAAFPPMQLPTANATATNAVNGTNNTSATRSQLPRPTEVKLPDIPPNHNVAPSQHRRTQSAPLLSLSPIAQTSPTETPNPITPPLTTAYPSNANVLQRSTSYNQLDTSVSLQQQPSYPQVNPMAQASVAATTTSFSPFPAMPPFTAGMPGVPQVASPLVWPQFFPQAAPTNFYTPRPPNMSPTSSPTAVPNMYSPTPSVTATWKINPNSQPQMPLSHLISQAQGLVVGGPSAHNRKIGLYKTEICRNWEEKQTCRYGVKCQFAHGPSDLRIVPRHPKYKTEICRVRETKKFIAPTLAEHILIDLLGDWIVPLWQTLLLHSPHLWSTGTGQWRQPQHGRQRR